MWANATILPYCPTQKWNFSIKKLWLSVALAPSTKRASEPGSEKLVEGAERSEAAEIGNGGYWRSRLPQQVEDALQPHLEDFIEDGMAHGLAESDVEKAAGAGEAACKLGDG